MNVSPNDDDEAQSSPMGVVRYLSRRGVPAQVPSSSLDHVYKTYVRPVLGYVCEVVTLASTTKLKKYDIVQNSSVRIINGGGKSAAITAMQLQTGFEPLDSRRDKFTLKFWRRVYCRYWNEYRCATQRLKTQTFRLSLAMKKHQPPLIMTHRAPIQLYSTVATSLPSKRLNLTNMT
ncbi:uncharacterized protein TNCV_2126731 [Trichonephila clavipes]|nr:uncharacterized protein TNCV_2126731 [Trichonephila clavipes]